MLLYLANLCLLYCAIFLGIEADNDFLQNRVHMGPEKSWNSCFYFFSGHEKSWNWTLVLKKSWFLSIVVLTNQITHLIFLWCDFHEVEVGMWQSQCTCISSTRCAIITTYYGQSWRP